MTDALAELAAAGVAIWLDDLSRERIETGMEAGERIAVRWKHQQVAPKLLELLDRSEPVPQRICERLAEAQ